MITRHVDQQVQTNGHGHRREGMGGELTVGGGVHATLFSPAPKAWRRKNYPNLLRALPAELVYRAIGKHVGLVMGKSTLHAKYILPAPAYLDQAFRLEHPKAVRKRLVLIAEDVLRGRAYGQVTDYGLISKRVITTAGVNFLVDGYQNLVEIEIMKFHASGSGVAAEAVGDTALGTEESGITDRATGSQTEGATGNIYKTVGTQSYTGSAAITEHGIFSVTTEGSGVLLDRSVFTALNVVNGSAIEWTYEQTLTAGG